MLLQEYCLPTTASEFKMIRKILAAAIGMIQLSMGVSLIVFVYIFHNNLFNFQDLLSIPLEQISFYMLFLTAIGFFSVISGLSFIQEWRKAI